MHPPQEYPTPKPIKPSMSPDLIMFFENAFFNAIGIVDETVLPVLAKSM